MEMISEGPNLRVWKNKGNACPELNSTDLSLNMDQYRKFWDYRLFFIEIRGVVF